jgi:hypothetical protein
LTFPNITFCLYSFLGFVGEINEKEDGQLAAGEEKYLIYTKKVFDIAYNKDQVITFYP